MEVLDVLLRRNGIHIEFRKNCGHVGGPIHRVDNALEQVPEGLLVQSPLLLALGKLEVDFGEVHSHGSWDKPLHEGLGEIEAQAFELGGSSAAEF